MAKVVSYILSILSAVMFIAGYHVAEYFYPGNTETDKDSWTDLRYILININFLLLAFLHFLPKTAISKGAITVLICLALGSSFDLVFLNITTFVVSDWVLILCSAVVGFIIYKRESNSLD